MKAREYHLLFPIDINEKINARIAKIAHAVKKNDISVF
ncbi:hypothetical protein LEP1GSC058_1687 [Leptospira fainei serovar Hurstbridge str. BUT 6]|uniref:Uncharacterized protein n=1 Tax=Leptospira fainei serovar Hurstbridge str. BUT 6 TaxID=1193011 RepID=S3V230_9LEPT|nr:hypothetical protein LEP1GSC058_1687 [Leptospira fainei serovar Hurstbridge str. BUT 6]